MPVGERIQQKMKEQRISQNRLAKAAQISQSGLSSIISGAVSPKEVTLAAIANALGCTVAELMGEDSGDQQEKAPRTPEARSLAKGIDTMPEAQRKAILEMMDGLYPNVFKKGPEENDT